MAAPHTTAMTCTLAGHASVRIAAEEVAAHRRTPGPACGGPLPASLLKHADEQTVAGVAAALRAIEAFGLAPDGTPETFRRWGIVAAPRFFSRDFMSRSVPDFVAEGPLSVTPQTIPHRTIHSPSGTLSLALDIQGPNHGAGGGPCAEIEGLLCALSLLAEHRLPGVWLLLSRIEPLADGERVKGQILPGTFAEAVALALVPASAARPGPALCLALDPAAEGPPLALDGIRSLLERIGQPGAASCPLPGFGHLELRPGRRALPSFLAPALCPVPATA